jgi:hypothetical protein
MPMTVAGVSVADESALADKVRSQLAGGAVWADKQDHEARDGMRRALRGAGQHQTLLAETVAGFLTDSDVTVRTGAVAVSDELAGILGADAIARIFEADESLFWKVPPKGHPINQPDLGWELLVNLGTALEPSQQRAIGVLRANAAGPQGSWLLGALAKHDTDWFLEHAPSMVPPRSILGLFRALGTHAQRVELARSVPWSSHTAREALAKSAAWDSLPLPDDQVAELRRIIAEAGGVVG